MAGIEYIDLFAEVAKKGFEPVALSCCNTSEQSFSLFRAQMQGDISYSTDGVWLSDPQHDEKCEQLLALAKAQAADLVLFPEYCISYTLLHKIVSDESRWPDENKLWCLPCQGIPYDRFEAFLFGLSKSANIVLINTAISRRVNRRKFVNALFYCFLVFKDDQPFLCLAPQMKTHHMSDPLCECETTGLTTGSRIFTLNKQLVTLLCADSMNNDINWQLLQDEELTNGILLLHPQMNSAPKHPTFRRLRHEMLEHTQPGICVTCNWAAGTRLQPAGSGSRSSEIKFSWSCIYCKHQDISFDSWKARYAPLWSRNAVCELFGAFMPKQRAEVWFSTSSEQTLLVHLPNLVSHQHGATQPRAVAADSRWLWKSSENAAWTKQEFCYCLCDRIQQHDMGSIAHMKDYLDPCYQYPFTESDKYKVDHFFALTTPLRANYPNECLPLTIDENENLTDWALLLEEEHRDNGATALRHLYELVLMLQNTDAIPEHLSGLKQPHHFTYSPAHNSQPSTNVHSEHQEMTIVFAPDDISAKKIVQQLVKTEFHGDAGLTANRLGVIYADIYSKIPKFLPEHSVHIHDGDHVMTSTNIQIGEHEIDKGDLTNG